MSIFKNAHIRIKKLTQVGSDIQTSTISITKRLIDTKRALFEELQKCKEFRVKAKSNGNFEIGSDPSDTEDEEFLDVDEKEG